MDKTEKEAVADNRDSDCTPCRETEEVASDRGGLNLLRLEYENERECCALLFSSAVGSVSVVEVGPILGKADASRMTPFPGDFKGESSRLATGAPWSV